MQIYLYQRQATSTWRCSPLSCTGEGRNGLSILLRVSSSGDSSVNNSSLIFIQEKKLQKLQHVTDRFRPCQINYLQKHYKVIKGCSRILALKMQLLPIVKKVLKNHNFAFYVFRKSTCLNLIKSRKIKEAQLFLLRAR